MAHVQLCSGASWASISDARAEWLKQPAGQSLFLIPPMWRSENIRHTFPNSPVMTTKELLERYLNHAFGIPQLLSRQSIEYLLYTHIFKSNPEQETTSARFFNIETYHQGYARALTEFIIDFREDGELNLLETLSEFKHSELSMKERDLIDVHDELENVLQARNLFDYRRALLTFIKDKQSGQPGAFLHGLQDATLIVFGFNSLTALESKLIGWLMYRFKRSVFAFCQNSAASDVTFRCQASLQIFMEKARQVFEGSIQEIELKDSTDSPVSQLAGHIFHDDKTQHLMPSGVEVRIQPANDRFSEVTRIARQIRKLNADGVAYDRMRVFFPNYNEYASLVMEIFPRYSIPCTLCAGTPLAFYPLGLLISNMLNHALAPNPFAIREHLFSSPYMTFACEVSSDDLHAFLEDISQEFTWINDIIDSRLPAPEVFELNFRDLLALKKQASRTIRPTEDIHPAELILRYLGNNNADTPELLKARIFQAIANQYLLTRAEKALYAWRSEMEPDAFSRSLEKLLAIFKIEKNINAIDNTADPVLHAVAEQDRRVLAVIRKLVQRLVAQFSSMSSKSGAKVPLTNLAQAFSGLMADADFYVPDVGAGGVSIQSPETAYPEFYQITFLGGMIDGDFPSQEPFNFLQPKSEGQAMTGGVSNVDRDRQALYQLIASTREQLFVSHPCSDNGKVLLVSPFVTEIQKCLSPASVLNDSSDEALYTSREKLTLISQHVDRAFDRAAPVLKNLQLSSPDYVDEIIAIMQCDGLRASIDAFSKYDGLIDSPAALAEIKSRIAQPFIFNAQTFERFAGCPLRFLLDDLARLKPEYLIDYHPDQTDRGLLIHKILTEYTRAAAATNRVPDDSAAILHKSASEALAEMPGEKDDLFSNRFRQGLLLGLENSDTTVRKRPGVLAAFLNFELTAIDQLAQHLADISFSNDPQADCAFEIDGIPIDLKIERVDRTSNGRYLIIFNYSVADLGDVDAIGKGLRFNLPLQILALRKLLSDQQQPKPGIVAGAGMYLIRNYRTIKRGGYFALKDLQASRKNNVSDTNPIFSGQRKFGFLPAANFEHELKLTQERIRHVRELIFGGRFHLPLCAAKDQICANCYFTRICRIEQLRLDKLYWTIDENECYKPLRAL